MDNGSFSRALIFLLIDTRHLESDIVGRTRVRRYRWKNYCCCTKCLHILDSVNYCLSNIIRIFELMVNSLGEEFRKKLIWKISCVSWFDLFIIISKSTICNCAWQVSCIWWITLIFSNKNSRSFPERIPNKKPKRILLITPSSKAMHYASVTEIRYGISWKLYTSIF